MSTTDTQVQNLIINKLSQSDYASIQNPSATELYLTPEVTIQALSANASITLTDNIIYNGGTQTSLTIALPSSVDVSFLCEIDFTSGATATTMTYPQSGIVWIGDGVASNVFVPETNTRYTIICAYDGVNYRFITKGV